MCGDDAFEAELLRFGRVFFEPVVECVLEGAGDEALDFWVEEFLFWLVVELRVGEFDGDDRDESFAEVVAGWVWVFFFEDSGTLCVSVERACECGFESLAVGSAVDIVDVVCEGEECLVVSVVVLERDLADHGLFFEFLAEVYRGRDGVLALHQVGDILEEAVFGAECFVFEFAIGADAFVGKLDGDTWVEECEFAESVRECLVDEVGVLEDLGVWLEGDGGACFAVAVLWDRTDVVDVFGDDASLEDDSFDDPVAPDFDFEE